MKRPSLRFVPAAVCAAALLTLILAFGQNIQVPPDILSGKNPLPASDAVLARGKTAFTDNCVSCHGTGGKGDGPMSGMLKERPADLSNAAFVGALTDGEIFWAITKGMPPVMPPFESKLKNPERWSLVHYLRDLSKTKPNTRPRSSPKQ